MLVARRVHLAAGGAPSRRRCRGFAGSRRASWWRSRRTIDGTNPEVRMWVWFAGCGAPCHDGRENGGTHRRRGARRNVMVFFPNGS